MTLLDLLIVVLLSAHLMAMNVASAGPFVCLWLARRAKRGDAIANLSGAWLARLSLIGLTGGIVLGGLVLCAIWYHRPEPFFRAAELIPRTRYWFGIAELAFSYLLMLIYLVAWQRFAGRWWHAGIALLAGTNTVYHFPPLFAAIGVLTTRPEVWNKAELSRQAFLKLLCEPETLARTSHFVLASFAVTGVLLLGLAMRLAKREASRDDAQRVGAWGGWLGLAPTVLQLMSGLWLLLSSPAPLQAALAGGETWSTVLFVASLLAAFALLPALAAAAFGTATRRDYLRAMFLLTVAILCMVAARHISLQRMYDRYSPRAGTAVHPRNPPGANASGSMKDSLLLSSLRGESSSISVQEESGRAMSRRYCAKRACMSSRFCHWRSSSTIGCA